MTKEVERIGVPSLSTGSQNDRNSTGGYPEYLKNNISGSKVKIIERGSYKVSWKTPDVLSRMIFGLSLTLRFFARQWINEIPFNL
jgi:hypothetical protein